MTAEVQSLWDAYERAIVEHLPRQSVDDGIPPEPAQDVFRALLDLLARAEPDLHAGMSLALDNGWRPHLVLSYPADKLMAAWFDASKVENDLDPASNLPGPLYARLRGGRTVGRHHYYDGVLAAWQDVCSALEEWRALP